MPVDVLKALKLRTAFKVDELFDSNIHFANLLP